MIVGGANGIGAATATELAAQGMKPILCDLDGEQASLVAAQLGGHGFTLDVTDRSACFAVAEEIFARFGAASVLVNSAGVARVAAIEDQGSPAAWDSSLDVNLTGNFNMVHSLLSQLRETAGVIVNVASVMAQRSSAMTHVGYSASKGGVCALTRALCRQLAEDGIRVNAVAPGFIETPMLAANMTDFGPLLEQHVPMKRLGRPEEVAKVIAFLCSDAASFVSGAIVPVDGGYLVV
ncbi:SDR family oxidoreductase [Rhodobacteraceae bacterium D3-12]|nr:SDR family oxidoreductase [Rhodobacteraceae bacterium D3-12]